MSQRLTLRQRWCRLLHPIGYLSRPINGVYRCWLCLEEFPCPWGTSAIAKDERELGRIAQARLRIEET